MDVDGMYETYKNKISRVEVWIEAEIPLLIELGQDIQSSLGYFVNDDKKPSIWLLFVAQWY
jgi:hypothetical protein